MSPSHYNFGTCSNPGITYRSSQSSFQPANTQQFPFPSSPDIATLEAFICNRLRDPDLCNADAEAIAACDSARWYYSGLAGQRAAEAWNRVLGIDGQVGGTVSGSGGGGGDGATTGTADAVSSLITSVSTSASAARPDSVTPATSDIVATRSSSTLPSTTPARTASPPSATPPKTAASADDGSNAGAPFGYQNNVSAAAPRKAQTTMRSRLLGLTSLLLLLFATDLL